MTKNTTSVLVPAQVLRELNSAKVAIRKRERKGKTSSSLPRLYTTKEVCAIFGINRHTVLVWNQLGVLRGHTLPGNNRLFFYEEDIQARIREWEKKMQEE